MEKLSNWIARRSGSTITVTGQDTDGKERQVTGVTSISRRASGLGRTNMTIAVKGRETIELTD